MSCSSDLCFTSILASTIPKDLNQRFKKWGKRKNYCLSPKIVFPNVYSEVASQQRSSIVRWNERVLKEATSLCGDSQRASERACSQEIRLRLNAQSLVKNALLIIVCGTYLEKHCFWMLSLFKGRNFFSRMETSCGHRRTIWFPGTLALGLNPR